jgi:hypothetical protein
MPGVVEHLFRHKAGKMVDLVPEALALATSDLAIFRRVGKSIELDHADFAPISRSMSYGASQSGTMGEGEHVKPSSHLA